LLAVNGLIETFGFYRRRLLHINLYASMTRRLTDAEVDALGGIASWCAWRYRELGLYALGSDWLDAAPDRRQRRPAAGDP
jgi:hypothetical protein